MKEDWLEELIAAADTDKRNEKQIKILQAAVDMFSEKGYASTSTNEIAKKAGVAEGTIFRYYKTKKELLMAIVLPALTKFAAPFFIQSFAKQVFEDSYDSYEQFLRTVIRNRFEFARKNMPILKILIQEVPFHPELKQEVQNVFEKELYSRFVGIIQQFQKQGDVIEIPAATIIRLSVSSLAGFLLTRFLLLPEASWDDEAEIEYTIQFILHGLTPRGDI
ncbi:TetR/AcrR family transcriptional regulator [Ectobacillus panaciterrae]|uniref:TetR/AcrR family transcriptional regulator n=1 Tax=Ectobacillus panaciterrae TaxID=363872 RepID=UPI00041683B5|nr:TetR/AcrR family transcriptional regulator [Ectobacillus panaciterrae]